MGSLKGESRAARTVPAFGCNYSGNYEVSMPRLTKQVNEAGYAA